MTVEAGRAKTFLIFIPLVVDAPVTVEFYRARFEDAISLTSTRNDQPVPANRIRKSGWQGTFRTPKLDGRFDLTIENSALPTFESKPNFAKT